MATLLRLSILAALAWAAWFVAAQTGDGSLAVEIVDSGSGLRVPAMVCITSLEDRKWRVPPDGRASPPYTTSRDFYDPAPWKPGEPGPVRLTNGEYNNNDIRSYVYEGSSAYPFWQEPAAYFVSQPFSIRLPAGRWRLAVARGLEYRPVFEELDIRAGQQVTRKVRLARWVDMGRSGWYSGDDHVHYPRTKPEHNQLLLTWAQAEDVHVVNVLRMGDLKATYFEQAAYGPPGRFQQGDYLLAAGQEDPRTGIGEQGHTIALNITSPVRDTSQYHLYDFMFDGVHQQGGLTGYAHKSWALEDQRRRRPGGRATWDSTINVVRGRIDFFEVMQFRRLGLEDYYDFLNLGFRLTASAGSDVPWGNTMGEVRVYVHAGRELSADAWFSAFKHGRTFVTNGPMIELTVNGRMPGDSLKVRRNDDVRIQARAWAPPEIGAPQRLEAVAQGRVIRSVEAADVSRDELKLEFSVRASSGQWIAARATSRNGAAAHTSPVYVLVDGETFQDREETRRLAQKRLEILEYVKDRLQDPAFAAEYGPGEAARLRERIEEARAWYEKAAR